MRWLLLGLTAAQIHILSPSTLSDSLSKVAFAPGKLSGSVVGSTATFGTPYYDERVTGRIRYGRPERNHHHCTETGYDIPDLEVNNNPEAIRIVLVDRGECSFVTKVRIAQDYKGANAVIVVDDTGKTPQEISQIIMADDGWGASKVHIPSILISDKEGALIRNAIEAGQEVIAELAWDIPTSNVVELDFWHSSGSREAAEFLTSLSDYVLLLRWKMQYRPHFHIFRLPEEARVHELCLDTSGKFCAPDPDGDGPVNGYDVILEDVRQYCIWREGREQDPDKPVSAIAAAPVTYSPSYWNYVVAFHRDCPLTGETPETRFGNVCAKKVQATVPEINPVKIDQCVLQRDQILLEQQTNVAWSPLAARINGWRYSGPLEAETVMKALCSGFITPLAECDQLRSNQYKVIRHMSGVAFLYAVLTAIILVIAIVATFYVYRRLLQKSVRSALREEVMLEVRSQMSDYQALDEGGRGTRRF